MGKELTLEEALAKITALEADKARLTSDMGTLEQALQDVTESSLQTIKELQEKLADTEAQKSGELPIRKISKGENAGRYQFTAASFKLKGEVIKAIDVKNDSEVLKFLVEKKSGVVVKVEESKA